MTEQERSDYFNWEPDDVQWEKPREAAPQLPPLADADEVSALPDRYLRQSGADHFEAMTATEQDETFGPEVAAALRAGTIKLSDLVARRAMETEPDFISQASPGELGLAPDTSSEE